MTVTVATSVSLLHASLIIPPLYHSGPMNSHWVYLRNDPPRLVGKQREVKRRPAAPVS